VLVQPATIDEDEDEDDEGPRQTRGNRLYQPRMANVQYIQYAQYRTSRPTTPIVAANDTVINFLPPSTRPHTGHRW
jgi:hypothetical protein